MEVENPLGAFSFGPPLQPVCLCQETVCSFQVFFLLRRGGHSTGLDSPPS